MVLPNVELVFWVPCIASKQSQCMLANYQRASQRDSETIKVRHIIPFSSSTGTAESSQGTIIIVLKCLDYSFNRTRIESFRDMRWCKVVQLYDSSRIAIIQLRVCSWYHASQLIVFVLTRLMFSQSVDLTTYWTNMVSSTQGCVPNYLSETWQWHGTI